MSEQVQGVLKPVDTKLNIRFGSVELEVLVTRLVRKWFIICFRIRSILTKLGHPHTLAVTRSFAILCTPSLIIPAIKGSGLLQLQYLHNTEFEYLLGAGGQGVIKPEGVQLAAPCIGVA